MKKCVSINSEEFKQLIEDTKIPAIKLAGIISLYQEQNNTDEFPNQAELDLILNDDLVDIPAIKIDNNKNTFIENIIENFYSSQEDNNFNFNKIDLEDDIDTTERKIEILKQSLNAEVIVDTSIPDSGQLLPANHPLTKQYRKPVIVINPNKLFSDTVIHEFGHLYIDLLGSEDGVLNQAYELLKGTDFYNDIAKQYPELNEEDLNKEVLATAIGIQGDKIFKDSLRDLSTWQKIKNYILNALSKMFNIQPNAIEKLATELLTNNVRLSGSEKYNTIITQRSKYLINENSKDKQSEVSSLLDTIQKNFTKESIDDENVYKDKQGNIYNNSVTKNIRQYKKRKNSSDKGDFEIKFDRGLYSEDNILMYLNSPKLPLALTKAMNDLIYDNLKSISFVRNAKEKNWFDAYNNEINVKEELSTNPLADLEKELLNKVSSKATFTGALIDNLELVLDKADEYQKGYNQAPIVGNLIHKTIEDYINNEITELPPNIEDDKDLLLNEIKSIIDNGKSKGSIFKTEQIVYSENKQVPGTIDLIEITKDGEVVLYDYKTINSFEGYNYNTKSKYEKGPAELYFWRGYAHQLLSYGAILSQYGITLADDAYKIVMIEVNYSNVESEESFVTVKEVRNKSLSDKDTLSSLNHAKNNIFRDYATSKQLSDIKIKPELNDLKDLSNKINDTINNYKKLTKNLNTNLDDSFINKIKSDLNQQELENDINKYVAKNNEIIIKSYIDNIHESLSALEGQKEFLGEIVSPDFLQALSYLLQSTTVLEDIKVILINTENIEDEINVEDKKNLVKLIDEVLSVTEQNKKYYKDKVKRSTIASFVENSNLMLGLHIEKYKMEANKQGKKGIEKDKYVEQKLRENKDNIKIKEINYWTKQYEDGITDLRFLEYLVADPGMSKSQFVQLTKNILDKTDMSVRNKMLDIAPDVFNWYDKLTFNKKGNPRDVWNKFLEKNNNKLTGAVIPEFTSKYRETFLKYEYLIKDEYKVLKKAKSPEEKEKINKKIVKLKEDKNAELKKGMENVADFEDSYIHPDFKSLSKKEQEDLRFIHKNLLEADERVPNDKRLTKQLNDGSIIFNLPRERQSNVESIKTGDKLKTFKSKIEDFNRPPSDEDEMNIEEYDANEDSFGNNNLDIYGNEVFTIPIYYRNQLEDDEMQSYDIPSLLVSNHETTIFYQEHKLVEADLFTVAESLSSRNNDKILKTDSFINKKIKDKLGNVFQQSDQNLVYQAVKSSIDNRLYKRNYKGVYSKNNYRLIKGLEAIGQYSSLVSLAGNFMSAFTTTGQGSIYRFLEANIGEHFDMNAWKKGTSKTMNDVPNMIKDTQRFVHNSKTNLLIKKMGLETQAKALANKFVQDNFAYKQLDQGTLFSVTSIAESIVTANLMYSLLSNIKVTNEKGEYINQTGEIVSKNEAMSLDEAYKVVDGKLVLNKFVKYTSFNITEKYNDGANKDNTVAATEISRYIRSIYADMYGQYNQDMKSVLQRNIFGKLAMSLRGWLPRGVHRRWRGITDVIGKDTLTFEELRDIDNIDKRFYSQDQRQFQEGHYATSIRFIKSLYKEMKANQLGLNAGRNKIKQTMSDHELANLKRTQYEIATFIVLATISYLLRAIAMNSEAPDEEKEKIYFAAYLAYRISNEVSTFFNPEAMVDMISNPAASITMIERLFDWLYQLIGVSFEEEGMNANFNDIYETGSKKGEYKLLMKSMGLIPGYKKLEQGKSILGLQSENSLKDAYEYQMKN